MYNDRTNVIFHPTVTDAKDTVMSLNLATQGKPQGVRRSDELYDFGPFRLDPVRHVLLSNGTQVSLGSRALEVPMGRGYRFMARVVAAVGVPVRAVELSA